VIAVHLHGPLATQFGKVWDLDIRSVREAVHAIDCMTGKFRAAIMELDAKGLVFKVSTSTGHELDDGSIGHDVTGAQRVDILPVVRGSSAGTRFVVGAILVATAVYTASPLLLNAGVALMLGSVVEWLTPVPKKADENGSSSGQSWSISGPTNTVEQGQPVPIVYGEVLTGGYVVSAGISVSSVSPSGSVAPAAQIGGNNRVNYSSKAAVPTTVVVRLSAGVVSLADPYAYTWTMGTFTGTYTTKNLVDSDKGVCSLEVTMTPTLGTSTAVSGTINLSVSGKEVSPANGASPATVVVNSSIPISISLLGV
jgi:predicted phage tail protein